MAAFARAGGENKESLGGRREAFKEEADRFGPGRNIT
jgi:hypothetical protein